MTIAFSFNFLSFLHHQQINSIFDHNLYYLNYTAIYFTIEIFNQVINDGHFYL